MPDPLTERTGLNAGQRRLRAQIAADTLWSKTEDPSAHTAPARAAFNDRFEREVDPDGSLTSAERARRAEYARKAYFARLALKSSQARAAKTAARRTAKGGGSEDAA
ncbi:hypothetical protein OG729_10165 [Streptomyces sp. NBC_00210]|uniref:hypothetical protein n=1 Tax=Streptomyces sp. NBC_00210 TaxID=2903636 RepID=UPI003248DA24